MSNLEDEEVKADKITMAMEALEKIEGELKGKSFSKENQLGIWILHLGGSLISYPSAMKLGSRRFLTLLNSQLLLHR